MPTYSEPFRLYLVKDPATGKRRQFTDEDAARASAAEIVKSAGVPLVDVLVASRYWYVTQYRDGGAVRRVNTKATTKHVAVKWRESRIVLTASGFTGFARKPLAQALEGWLDEKKLGGRSAKTLRDYRVLADGWKEHLGPVLVSDVTHDDLVRFFSDRAEGKIGGHERSEADDQEKATWKPSKATLVKERVLLGGFFKWARKRGYCQSSPVEDCPKWKLDKPVPDALSRAELARLLAACREPYTRKLERKARRPTIWDQKFLPPAHLYGIALTAVHTLLRLGNVLGLRWGSIDLEEAKLVIAGKEVKTGRALEIPLTPTLREYLASLERGTPSAYVFINPETGDRFAPDALKRSFRSAAKRAGLSDLRFHTLRKSGATLLLESGVPLHVVQRLGGWKKPDVLLRHYAAATTGEKARAVKILDKVGR